tara:strand:+ start:100 stop:1050 length:951 start_codon:yes stop_codon:yes gene_type:complete
MIISYQNANIVFMGVFSILTFFKHYVFEYNYVIKRTLQTYFITDSIINYKNPDIVLHHITFGSFIEYSEPNDIYMTLIFEWSTFFLLLYRKYKSDVFKYLFAFLWITLRILYSPIVFYKIINSKQDKMDKYIYCIGTIIMYSLFNNWTCKILHKNIDTKFGFSSMFLYSIPLLSLIHNNTFTFENYYLIYAQSTISFYFNVINEQKERIKYWKIIRNIDLSFTTIFSSKYFLRNNYAYLAPLYSFIVKEYVNDNFEFHSYLLIYSMTKICIEKPDLIFFILPGMFSMYVNMNHGESILDKSLCHLSYSVVIANTLI